LVRPNKANPTIQVKETDLNSVRFVFSVQDDGMIVDLTGTNARLAIQKPSGLTVFQDCEIIDPITGVCEVILSSQAYVEIGNYSAELVLTSGDVTSVTRAFTYTSLNAIMDDETLQSANDWQTLHEIMLNADLRPILGDGSPNGIVTPEYQGQTYLDRLGMTMYYASTLENDGWLTFGTGGGGGEAGTVYWTDVLNKPLTFPPSAHNHTWAEISDAPTAMPPTAHTHDWNTGITNKPTTFPPEPHTHDEYISKAQGDALYQPIGEVPTHTHPWADVTGKPTTFTPPVMSGAVVGGARVGNGLKMVGEYLTIRDGLGIKTNTTTSALDVDKVAMDTWYTRTTQNLAIWKGTQVEYDAIPTKDANTLYFIVG
jgi:hypothetical protein